MKMKKAKVSDVVKKYLHERLANPQKLIFP